MIELVVAQPVLLLEVGVLGPLLRNLKFDRFAGSFKNDDTLLYHLYLVDSTMKI